MGKYFWMKRGDEKHKKQPGCMFGIANVLGYHLWQSSGRKKIQHNKYEAQGYDTSDRSSKTRLFQHNDDETESLLDGNQSPYLNARRTPDTKKRSHRARIKSLIAEEISKESENNRGKGGSVNPSLQRTYSIHHLETLDVDWKHHIIFFPGKVDNSAPQAQDATETKPTGGQEAIRGQSKRTSKDAIKHDSQRDPDVLEMFALDKGLLMKHLQHADEGIANFSRSALGLAPKAKLSKSRSFPMPHLSQGRKLKPVKLESKQKEVWSYPRKNVFRAVSQPRLSDCSDYLAVTSGDAERNGAVSGDSMIQEDAQASDAVKNCQTPLATDNIEIPNKIHISENNGEITDENFMSTISRNDKRRHNDDMRKYAERRSSSLKESLDKYARLFENSSQAAVKLSSSRSLKVANEYGHAPVHSRRMLSLSNVDFYYLTPNFEAWGNDPKGNGSVVTSNAIDSGLRSSKEENIVSLPASDGNNSLNTNVTDIRQNEPADGFSGIQIKEDECLLLPTSDDDREKVDSLKEEESMPEKNDVLGETNCTDIIQVGLPEQSFILDSDIFSEGAESRAQLETAEDLESELSIAELNFSVDSNEMKSHQNEILSTHITEDLENDEIPKKTTMRHPKMNVSDLDYVRHLLDQSGIANDAAEMSWHSSEEPFGPELFEEVEARWPHEQDQLTGWPDFYGCWHHHMLFDLLNEVTLEVYDISLPYYPKALSSSCQVRPFPAGNRMVEEVSMSIDALLNLKPEEMLSVDSIVAIDLAHDRSWMNLQTEAECVALELEDMIFDEVLEEIMFS